MAPEPEKRKTRNASAKDKKADPAKIVDNANDIVIPQEDLQILDPPPIPKPPIVTQGGANRDPPPIVSIEDQLIQDEDQQQNKSSSDSSQSSSDEDDKEQGPRGPGGEPITDQQKMDGSWLKCAKARKPSKMKKKHIKDKLKYKTALKQAFRTSPTKQHIQLPATHLRVQMKVTKIAQGQSYTEYLAEV